MVRGIFASTDACCVGRYEAPHAAQQDKSTLAWRRRGPRTLTLEPLRLSVSSEQFGQIFTSNPSQSLMSPTEPMVLVFLFRIASSHGSNLLQGMVLSPTTTEKWMSRSRYAM